MWPVLLITIIMLIYQLFLSKALRQSLEISAEVHQPCSALACLLEDGEQERFLRWTTKVLVPRPFLMTLTCVNRIRSQCTVKLILEECFFGRCLSEEWKSCWIDLTWSKKFWSTSLTGMIDKYDYEEILIKKLLVYEKCMYFKNIKQANYIYVTRLILWIYDCLQIHKIMNNSVEKWTKELDRIFTKKTHI